MSSGQPPTQGEVGSGSYRPLMSPERVERIRRWHTGAYRELRARAGGDQTFSYLGRTLVVSAQVMPIVPLSHLLGEAVLSEVTEADRVLDMGTGCGVNAILAASRSSQVVAVDINPHALAAARDNAVRNGVADRIQIRDSDVFSNVDGAFDLIIFDPPFRWFAPRDLLEAATTDENYQALTRFFRQARQHLTHRGRILIFFGSSGDLDYLRHLIDQEGFQRHVLAQHRLDRDGWQVDYFTFRLTANPSKQGRFSAGLNCPTQ